MTTRADFTTNGANPFGDYMAGRDANVERARVLDANQQVAYLNERNRSLYADADIAATNIAPPNPAAAFDPNAPASTSAPAAPTPSAGLSNVPPPTAAPAAPSRPMSKAHQALVLADMQKQGITNANVNGQPFNVPGSAPAQGTGVADAAAAPGTSQPASGTGLSDSPGAPAPLAGGSPSGQMSTDQKQAANYRQQQALALRSGDFKTANDLESKATTADMNHVIDSSAHIADNAALWTQAAKMVTVKDPSLTIGKDDNGVDFLSIQQPDGTATFHTLTAVDKRNMIAGQALMEAGYHDAGLGKFAQVNAALAAEVATRNKLTLDATQHNNQAYVAQQNSDAKMIGADARTSLAQAMTIRAEAYAQGVQNKADKAGAKEVPTEITAAGNKLIEQYTEEMGSPSPNQTKLRNLITAINANTTAAANSVGKPRMMPEQKAPAPAKPVSEQDVDTYMSSRSLQDKDYKGLSFTDKRAAALDALTRKGSDSPNALPAWGAEKAPPPAKTATPAPAGPSMQDRARAALQNTPAGQTIGRGLQMDDAAALAAKNSFNPYAQTKVR